MAKITFNGPEGAKFAGKTLRWVDLIVAEGQHIAALQTESGAKMSEVIRWSDPENELIQRMWVVLFLTLRTAGFFEPWDAVTRLTLVDYEVTAEPGDELREPEDEAQVPPSAPTASGRGGVSAAPATRRKPSKTSAKR